MISHWWIAGGLVALGIILFFVLARRKNYRDPTAAQNYEKVRNKLTTREKEEEPEEEEYSGGGGFLGNLIGGFIVILVGTSLAPEVAKAVASAQSSANVTGATDTMLGLTTLFFTLAIVTAGLGMAFAGFKNSGVI